jgi:hypothetical protein
VEVRRIDPRGGMFKPGRLLTTIPLQPPG